MTGENEVTSQVSNYSETDIKVDDGADKLEALEKLHGVDLDEYFLKFEQLYQESQQNMSFYDRMVSTEIKVHFQNKKHMVYMLAFFASMAGILSGCDQSLISGAALQYPSALHMDSHEQSLVSSLMPLGAVAGSILMSPLNEAIGRRTSIIGSCIAYTLGAALCAGSRDGGMLYAGRFILGIGIGLESVVPAYVSECAPSAYRGNMVSLYQFNIALGEVFGYSIAAMFEDVHGGWRFIFGSSLVFSTILFIGMFFLPESPRYLVHKGKVGLAYGVWKRLRDMDDVANKIEFLDMTQQLEQQEAAEGHTNKKMMWLDFFTVPRCRRSLIYANIMIILGQFTGVNAVMYYMSTLMKNIGFSDKNAVNMSLVGGAALLFGTIPAIMYMDTCGRRFWANSMLPGFFIGLICVGVGYLIPIENRASKGVYLTGVILYMGFFGSYACLTWVVPAEVYPTYLRSYGMTCSSSLLYLCSFIITYNFTKMTEAMTYTGLTLGFYGGIAFIGWIYQLLMVPETKGKTLEEIDDIFSKPTSVLMAINLKNTKRDFYNIFHGNFKQVIKGDSGI
ncbi:unnamed protein product [Kuraishia capsulata CBS 1993]|uniref:Major facilitator superfamily (MFS) profile domain-containing protein n=1 Tax=Kuraishia capsulata CBS 1993 TaxID=1382522 RepID=W6MJ23_9ASCO|nr:uncharacterized protein KUCA_T00002182001 [Kuraishia capsulata CBS 1993]CDK26211.1 unnamed protein product [Kuraishia capsulata CBS 1993]